MNTRTRIGIHSVWIAAFIATLLVPASAGAQNADATRGASTPPPASSTSVSSDDSRLPAATGTPASIPTHSVAPSPTPAVTPGAAPSAPVNVTTRASAGGVQPQANPDPKCPASGLSGFYEQMRRHMGDDAFAGYLRGQKRHWGNYQGICGTGIVSMSPAQRRAFEQRERELQTWLDNYDRARSGSQEHGAAPSDGQRSPSADGGSGLAGAATSVGSALGTLPRGVQSGSGPPGPGLSDAFTHPESSIAEGGAWVKVGDGEWRYFTRHALQHMQPSLRNASITTDGVKPQGTTTHYLDADLPPTEGRGVPRSVVENAIRSGEGYAGFTRPSSGPTTVHYDPINDISVRLNDKGHVVTVQRGKMPEVGSAARLPASSVAGLARLGLVTAGAFLAGEGASWVGRNLGLGMGQAEVEPGVTVHDEWATIIRDAVGDELLLTVDDIAESIGRVLEGIEKPLEPVQAALADGIQAIIGDEALLTVDQAVTDGGRLLQQGGRFIGTVLVEGVQWWYELLAGDE